MADDRVVVTLVRGDIWSASEKWVLTHKPRPVVIVQNDPANRIHATIRICLISATLTSSSLFRILVAPSATNGLLEIQGDRSFSFQCESLDNRIDALSIGDMAQVDTALRRWLDL